VPSIQRQSFRASGIGRHTSHQLEQQSAQVISYSTQQRNLRTAISDTTDTLASQLASHHFQGAFYNGIYARGAMWLTPFRKIKVRWPIQWDGVAMEQIGHDDEVAIGGELVGDQLGIYKFVANDVGED
jgi:hypothetical protein